MILLMEANYFKNNYYHNDLIVTKEEIDKYFGK